MDLEQLENKSIAILGFGQEGQAVLSYLISHGFKATVLDKNDVSNWPKDAQELLKVSGCDTVTGPEYLSGLEKYKIIFRSPGIWRQTPEILEAEKNGSTITSQAQWFFKNCPSQIIGVTGTKGKGTTCSLIYSILKNAGKQVFLTGNIGKEQPLEILDKLSNQNFIVYELSSFQLQDLQQSPHIGVCLMVTSDHLNHHADLGEYHEAKEAIVKFQTPDDIAIYNEDFEASKIIGLYGGGIKQTFSAKNHREQGAYIDEANNRIEININGDTLTIDCTNRKLRGVHNLQNIAAASLVAVNLNIPVATIEQTVTEFAGLEHRLQLVGEWDGVKYYNDSISTVPETTIAALNSFTEPVHLFLGGEDKKINYSGLIADLKARSNVASIILLGQIGDSLKTDLVNAGVTTPIFGPYTDFAQAVSETKQRAKSGEIVLLSPGASSFGMFENYADRGRKFVALVSQTNG